MSPHGRASRHDLERIARNAMLARGLAPDFDPAALAEAAALGQPPSAPETSLRDLRERLWASIDNDDSRDLDQLSVAESAGSGAVTVLVAIADVDALVRPGSAIDAHARHNTTSVYTAARVFPMLPERLSTDLTSLGEGEDRPALVVEMGLDSRGTVTASAVYRAVVRNHAKLAYDGVAAWLDGRGPAPARIAAVPGLDAQLRLQDGVARALRSARHEHGALTLETIEPEPVFDADALMDLRPREPNRARELIEELMIAANGVTAHYLERQGLPSVRRVVRSPERWARIQELAAGLGSTLPPEPDAGALEAFLVARRRLDPTGFADLSLTVIKLLGRGEYVVDAPGQGTLGHFGLAVRDYTHATAPNRRFPDLLTQRLLKAALGGRPSPYTLAELEAVARWCTGQEDNANKVERQVRKSAAALLLQGRIGQAFDAVVTGAGPKGTWVRITHPPVEGKVVRGSEGLDVGDRVRVRLVGVEVERGYIDFAAVGR